MHRRRSIRTRITLLILVVSSGLLILMSMSVYFVFDRQLTASLDDTLEIQAETNKQLLTFGGSRVALQQGAGTIGERSEGDGVLRLYDRDGQLLDDASPITPANRAEQDVVLQSIATEQDVYETIGMSQDEDFRILASPVYTDGALVGVLVTAIERSEVDQPLRTLQVILLIAVPLTTVALGLGGYWVARRALAPVAEMTNTAEQIVADNVDARLQGADAQDELGQLARTLNAMLERLQHTILQERQFASDASHELRTPLAVIESGIDVTLSKERSPAEYQRVLGLIQEQTHRLRGVTNQLLMLARMDVETIQHRFELVNLAELVPVIVDPLGERYPDARMTLEIADDPLVIVGDLELVARALINLLENALIHGGPDVSIDVAVNAEPDGMISIAVSDNGPGIPDDLANALFERFRRGESSSEREGSGLGLAIVRAIMQVHGGTVELVPSRDAGGARFVLRFPTAERQ